MLRLVVPVTFPLIVSVSVLPSAKFVSRATEPPPANVPDSVSASPVSPSRPASSVPRTSSVPTVRLRVPVPKETDAPEAISILSQLLSL